MKFRVLSVLPYLKDFSLDHDGSGMEAGSGRNKHDAILCLRSFLTLPC